VLARRLALQAMRDCFEELPLLEVPRDGAGRIHSLRRADGCAAVWRDLRIHPARADVA
jgi:hypothetical protein